MAEFAPPCFLSKTKKGGVIRPRCFALRSKAMGAHKGGLDDKGDNRETCRRSGFDRG